MSRRVKARAICLSFPLIVAWAMSARADEPTFPLSVAVAEEAGAPAESEAWISAQVDSAEALFGPLGVHFRWTIAKSLAAGAMRIETRADRDALGKEMESRAINVFVVASLRDVDDPSLHRMGVCWQSRIDKTKRFVILSAASRPTVLAHELGHFFGNGHSTVTDNVMSYSRTDGAVFFDAAQTGTILSWARRYQGGELLVLGSSRAFP